jgi:hypothetical protein
MGHGKAGLRSLSALISGQLRAELLLHTCWRVCCIESVSATVITTARYYAGADQSVHRVTSWPGQEAQSQHGKIPSVVWYDTNQKVSLGGIL